MPVVSKTDISRKIPNYFKFVKKMNLNVRSFPGTDNQELMQSVPFSPALKPKVGNNLIIISQNKKRTYGKPNDIYLQI